MHETKQEWNHKQQGIHNIYSIVDKCNYNWCCDSLYSSKLNDLLDVISLFPQFFFNALFVEMQHFLNLNVIKTVIFHHVMKFKLSTMCHCHLHNFLSHLRQPIHLCSWRIILLELHLYYLPLLWQMRGCFVNIRQSQTLLLFFWAEPDFTDSLLWHLTPMSAYWLALELICFYSSTF